ncbi:MAG: DMT family transporter, partial [Raoultibacter sp.]
GGISAIALAFYTLLPVKVLKKWGSLIVTGLAMLIAGVVATVFVRPWTIPVAVDGTVALVLALMVVIGTVAAYVLYLQGITDAGPVKAGLVGCIEPVAATFISAVWLNTAVSILSISSACL